MVLRTVLLFLARQRSLQRLAMRGGLLRGLARRFVAGDRLEEGIATAQALNQRGLMATLDYLGEHVAGPADAVAAADAYVAALEAIDRAGVNCNVSLKLTQLGLDLSDEFALASLWRVVERARELDNFVRIDMESSAYTQRTLDLFFRLWPQRRNVGVVIQAYLRRSPADVERLIAAGVRVRLCKGAYNEPSTVAFPSKRQVDEQYARLMERLLCHGHYPAIATHDERLIGLAQALALEHGIGPERFEFQMLLGIRRDLQEKLVRQGYRVRVYVPYGEEWYPYLMRRLAERPANLLFFLRQLAR